jgi:hypothetical protein
VVDSSVNGRSAGSEYTVPVLENTNERMPPAMPARSRAKVVSRLFE